MSDAHRPEPPVPETLDLRDFAWMPLDTVRLRDSDLAVVATGDEFRAAVLLWCAAWHQVPAASLPDDDRLLANLAGFGRDVEAWKAARDGALRGFILCADGRLYHPVVAEKALEAAKKKQEQHDRTEKARAARQANRDKQCDSLCDRHCDNECNKLQQTRPDRTGPKERKKNSRRIAAATAPCAPDRFDEFWRECPKREGDNPKGPARKKFAALVKSGVDPQAIIDGVKRHAADARKRGDAGTRFVPQAITWLNQERWNDYAPSTGPPAIDWNARVEKFKGGGIWPVGWGPQPSSSGCKAPIEVLAQHGFATLEDAA